MNWRDVNPDRDVSPGLMKYWTKSRFIDSNMAKCSQPAGSISDTSDMDFTLALHMMKTLCTLNNGVL